MSGTTSTWVGGNGTDWNTPANWTNGVPNGANATAIVNSDDGTRDAIISGGSSVTLASIIIGNTVNPTPGDVGGHVIVGGSPAIGGGGGGTLTSIGTISAPSTNPGGGLVSGIGGRVIAPAINIGVGATIGGGGTFDVATIINSGRIQADGGFFDLGPLILNANTIAGTGTIELDGSSALQLNARTAQEIVVVLTPTETGTIIFDNPATFTGPINLANPNTHLRLFFKNQTPTGASYADNSLIITGPGGTIDTIPFASNGAVLFSTPVSSRPGYGEVSIIGTAPGAGPGASVDLSAQIVLQQDGGAVQSLSRTGASTVESTIIGNAGPTWHVKGTGDFNNDIRSDLLYQNDDGTVATWFLNGASVTGVGVIGPNPGPAWHVIGTEDFNRDGSSDILFQNDDGSVAVWNVATTSVIGASLIGPNPGPAWHVKGTGDFSGTGATDILFQNDDGSVAIWNVNGSALTGAALVGPNPGTTWHVKGTADFNGDGRSDILFQNDDGNVAVWTVNGTALTGATLVGSNPGPTWNVKGASDLNGDGLADILFQNDNGAVAVWDLVGTSVGAASLAGANPGSNWHVVGTDRMNFINGNTGPGTFVGTSQPDTFVLSAFPPGAYVISGFNPAQDVIEFSKSLFANFGVLQANTGPSSADTLINLGGGSSLILQNLAPAALRSTDFVFV